MQDLVKTNYRNIRRGTLYRSPAESLRIARSDAEKGKQSHLDSTVTPKHNLGEPFKHRGETWRWVESPHHIGLRFVGFSDEIVKLDHNGWYTHPDGDPDEVLRGAVFQLPGRDGNARFIMAIPDLINGNGGPHEPAQICTSRIFEEWTEQSCEGWWSNAVAETQACKDCARAADHEAQTRAERECEYNTAFTAGSLYYDRREQISSDRKRLLLLFKEIKQWRVLGSKTPLICAELQTSIREVVRDIRKAQDECRKLKGGFGLGKEYWRTGFHTGDAELCAAFNDGAGENII